ncbi:capsular polysaccharide export protein KpsC [Mycolicibacterium novocastrense]|uniref:Capsular polysaccharide export protein KpsC n=1 Tax=Mycolicibacterium novocastrense TaxID=59813 RepID=A0ABQ0KS05_MYCNV|nr:capsular polysaccharide export protein KpsC [Mycolicibacterium novocastrense]
MKTTKPEAVNTNSHPVLSITHVSALPDADASDSVLTKPHTKNAMAMTAVTPKTIQSTPRDRVMASSPGGRSSAGWGTTESVGDSSARRVAVLEFPGVSFSALVVMVTQFDPAGGERVNPANARSVLVGRL